MIGGLIMKKWIPFVLIVLLGLAIFFIKKCGNDAGTDRKREKDKYQPATVTRNRGFDRRISYLKYSNHAICRMDCRKISRQEVQQIMEEGKINYKKSDVRNARCPRYALEGTTQDGQRVRIVFAQCNDSTVVVTVIDLETEFACDCPGDDNKFKNRN